MSAKSEELDHELPNPPRRGLKKGLYLVPSAFTAANIAMGFLSVMSLLRGFQLLGGANPDVWAASAHFNTAVIAIGFALLFDMVDGRIARLTKTTTEIGIQLDSIADVVTFGLAPAVLAYVWGYGITLGRGEELHQLAWFVSFIYLMCGAFRLARFNVQASRPRVMAEGAVKTDKKSFVGLPIPVAGGFIAALVHFSPVPLIYFGPERSRIYAVLLMVWVGVLSLMMVSTLRFSSFKTVGTNTRSMRPIILALALLVLVFLYSKYVLLAIVVMYILHGLLSRVVSVFWRRSDSAETKIEANPVRRS